MDMKKKNTFKITMKNKAIQTLMPMEKLLNKPKPNTESRSSSGSKN